MSGRGMGARRERPMSSSAPRNRRPACVGRNAKGRAGAKRLAYGGSGSHAHSEQGLAAAGTLAASVAFGSPQRRNRQWSRRTARSLSFTRSLARARSAMRGGRRPGRREENCLVAGGPTAAQASGASVRDGGGGGGAERIMLVEFVALYVRHPPRLTRPQLSRKRLRSAAAAKIWA
jgi:hypothetical protein